MTCSPSLDFFVFSSFPLSPPASRPRPVIDESRRLEVGAGPKGMRLKRGQARVNRAAICVDLRRFAVLVVKPYISYNHDRRNPHLSNRTIKTIG